MQKKYAIFIRDFLREKDPASDLTQVLSSFVCQKLKVLNLI